MAQADDDDYGILTLLVQLDFAPQNFFKIPPECFFPSPDVDSVRDFGPARAATVAGKLARKFCENRQTRIFATAKNDAETIESRLAAGKTGDRLCRIKNFAAGTRGEIELGTICRVDRKALLSNSKISLSL